MRYPVSLPLSFLVGIGLVLQACAAAPSSATPQVAATQTPGAAQSFGSATSQPVVHTSIPGSGGKQEANAHDNDESASFTNKDVQSGDQFKINRFERPFTANDMEYLPYIDIKNMSISSDDTWYYIEIELVGLGVGNQSPNGFYGAEFDLDADGRTEFMIVAAPPFDSTWTTDGVSVYWDSNRDIGGPRVYPDEGYSGDGYETVLVNSGQGSDPDLAWVMFSGSDKPVVELAVKRYLFAGATSVMWDVFASKNTVDPGKFYFNDTMTAARAGSPRKANKFYPLKQLWGFDNTCRVPLGFDATGTEPMGCAVDEENPPDVPLPPTGCPPGKVCGAPPPPG